MVDKTEIYFQFGVKSCWIVMPAIRAVLVYNRPGHYAFFHADDTLRDEALGLELPLGLVFA
ncbi:Uma2 family endonuclease [Hymenobacter psoromatis]|uniref:Uma2 family endonuclease n=1 Tax=Hymenobacter psoromatis TaxID=1484116 RepID=UPI0021D43C8B|nr:Uma2 family endonuclease [Hymenobacter psoromatis]